MAPYDILKRIVDAFESLDIPYFVTGSVASFMYGEPRFTNDADIVADLKENHIAKLHEFFPDAEYYFDEDMIRDALRKRAQFNIIHPASGFKVDIVIRKPSKYDESRFNRIRRLHPDDSWEANYASPEDVILKKMEFYQMGQSEKHLRDITGILKVSGANIDRSYIQGWAEKLGLTEIWQIILSRVKKTAE